MKSILRSACLLATFLAGAATLQAQYYYKDILGTQETADLIRTYQARKVTRVQLTSFDADNTRSDEFFVEQVFSPATGLLRTTTRSGVTGASVLLSYIDASGRVVKTVDSSESLVSTSTYTYDAQDRLQSVQSTSSDPAGSTNQSETHLWQYEGDGISGMLRIKNGVDTTRVTFVRDEQGNVSEERALRRGVAAEPVYYYYNADNRLSDIVRYSNKARRLLPEYMFEYAPAGQVIQKITVPAHSSDYLIWRYQYDAQGLKIKEAVYNKQKQLTGKIEYQYQFGS